MATYGIREFKARASEILRNVEAGEEVVITRRGKPCGKLTGVLPDDAAPQLSLATLRGPFGTSCPKLLGRIFRKSRKSGSRGRCRLV